MSNINRMKSGLIIKALSGFYYVQPDEALGDEAAMLECRARGQFKLSGVHPLVGDRVLYEEGANRSGTVVEVKERHSELVRPPIANVDQVFLVFSAKEPAPNWQLLDKFLVHTSAENLDTRIIFSKIDLLDEADDGERDAFRRRLAVYETVGYEVYETNHTRPETLEPLKRLMAERITVLAGQSGVGKSSLLNAMVPGLQLQTGSISQKLGRGKHTTRHVELHPTPGRMGWVADTPGFSQLDFFGLPLEQLNFHFHEFEPLHQSCKFRVCSHLHEPGCAVLDALQSGRIDRDRHESYAAFYQEIKETKRRY